VADSAIAARRREAVERAMAAELAGAEDWAVFAERQRDQAVLFCNAASAAESEAAQRAAAAAAALEASEKARAEAEEETARVQLAREAAEVRP
jgi:hypothetical protein